MAETIEEQVRCRHCGNACRQPMWEREHLCPVCLRPLHGRPSLRLGLPLAWVASALVGVALIAVVASIANRRRFPMPGRDSRPSILSTPVTPAEDYEKRMLTKIRYLEEDLRLRPSHRDLLFTIARGYLNLAGHQQRVGGPGEARYARLARRYAERLREVDPTQAVWVEHDLESLRRLVWMLPPRTTARDLLSGPPRGGAVGLNMTTARQFSPVVPSATPQLGGAPIQSSGPVYGLAPEALQPGVAPPSALVGPGGGGSHPGFGEGGPLGRPNGPMMGGGNAAMAGVNGPGGGANSNDGRMSPFPMISSEQTLPVGPNDSTGMRPQAAERFGGSGRMLGSTQLLPATDPSSLRRELRRRPDDPHVVEALGGALVEVARRTAGEDPEQAESLFREALSYFREAGRRSELRIHRGMFLLLASEVAGQLEEWERQYRLARQATEEIPYSGTAWRTLNAAALRTGHYRESLKARRESLAWSLPTLSGRGGTPPL
ncbi:MAG: tetratricopeptide repeat protein [Armatimonadota bacterium]